MPGEPEPSVPSGEERKLLDDAPRTEPDPPPSSVRPSAPTLHDDSDPLGAKLRPVVVRTPVPPSALDRVVPALSTVTTTDARAESPSRAPNTLRSGSPRGLVGTTLGRYEVLEEVGHGGMATVYRARDPRLERDVALKVIHRHLRDNQEIAQRFQHEAKAVAKLRHPTIVEIYDVPDVDDDEERFLVAELVEGPSLRKYVQELRAELGHEQPGLFPPEVAAALVLQILSALGRAHEEGIIHRDVKPENILLVQRRDGGDVVKLTDFGVAKITGAARNASGADQVFGTPGYVAPEYLLGETAIDGRADLYSLGVVLYQAITGELPFDAEGEADLLTRPLTEEPIPPSTRVRDLHPSIEALVLSLLRRRADERPNDAFAFLDALQRAATEAGLHGLDVHAAPRIEEVRIVPRALDAEAVEEEPPPSRFAPTIPEAPRLGVVTPGVLVTAWRSHWEAIAEHVERARHAPEHVEDAAHRAKLLVEGLDRAVTIVSDTQRALDALEAEARDFRGTIGNAIDHLARDLSRAHARVVELTSQRAQLHLRRRNAPDRATADALLWEEAAVDDDLRKAKVIREDLGHQIGTLQDELFRRNTAHEDRVRHTSAALEGEAAAIATFHRELEVLSAELARFVGSAQSRGA